MLPNTCGDANWRDKLTAVNGSTIRYDAIGNPLNDGTWTYTWQNGRQLQKMQKAGVTAEFVYNADGLRVQKTVNGVVTGYTLHGKNVVHMTKGNDELHFFYDAQNRPAVVVYNGVPYAYVKSLQGDIVAILDENGNTVVSYGYDAWGAPLWCTGELATTLGTVQPFRYRGYVFDEETGLYYLRSRYYKPQLCRFINADVQICSSDEYACHNLFSYSENKPVLKFDPDGFEAITAGVLTTEGLGAAIAAAAAEPTFIGEIIVGLYVLSMLAFATTYDPDPYGRAGQKKQGRENKNKGRKDKNWKPRNNRRDGKPHQLPKHTPGREHRKFIAPIIYPAADDELFGSYYIEQDEE